MRLRIVAALADGGEQPCGAIELPVVKSTCTHHFRVLREAGLIRQRTEGTTKLNSLRRDELDASLPWPARRRPVGLHARADRLAREHRRAAGRQRQQVDAGANLARLAGPRPAGEPSGIRRGAEALPPEA